MVFFFAAFSIDWWSPGNISSRTIVSCVILVVFVMMAYSVILIRKADWQTTPLRGGIGLELLSHMADAWKQVVEFTVATCSKREPRSSTEGVVGLAQTTDLSPANAEANAVISSIPHSSTSPYLNPSNPIRSWQPASVDSPRLFSPYGRSREPVLPQQPEGSPC
jgi:hypothetical protein